MTWIVEFVEEFESEFDALVPAVQDELLAQAKVIEHFGPAASRPRVDTLKGSRYAEKGARGNIRLSRLRPLLCLLHHKPRFGGVCAFRRPGRRSCGKASSYAAWG